MLSKKNKRRLKLIIILCFILLISPIIFITSHFSNQPFSTKITDWGAFGDYIGGFINTIISFISLLFLGYLTYFLSKKGNEENRKTNILMRKLDAYNELTIYFPKINQLMPEWGENLKITKHYIDEKQSLNDVNFTSNKHELIKKMKLFPEFHYFLHSFNVRFGHLFKYDFQNDDFISLMNNSKDIELYFYSVTISLELSESKINEVPDFQTFFDKLLKLINELRKELNINE